MAESHVGASEEVMEHHIREHYKECSNVREARMGKHCPCGIVVVVFCEACAHVLYYMKALGTVACEHLTPLTYGLDFTDGWSEWDLMLLLVGEMPPRI